MAKDEAALVHFRPYIANTYTFFHNRIDVNETRKPGDAVFQLILCPVLFNDRRRIERIDVETDRLIVCLFVCSFSNFVARTMGKSIGEREEEICERDAIVGRGGDR